MVHTSMKEGAWEECGKSNKKKVPFYLACNVKGSSQVNIKRTITLQDISLAFSFPFQLQANSVLKLILNQW